MSDFRTNERLKIDLQGRLLLFELDLDSQPYRMRHKQVGYQEAVDFIRRNSRWGRNAWRVLAFRGIRPPGKTPRRSKNESRRVIPLGVNAERWMVKEFRALARCSGKKWSAFVVCALINEAGGLARRLGLDFSHVSELPPARLAQIGRRVAAESKVANYLCPRNHLN